MNPSIRSFCLFYQCLAQFSLFQSHWLLSIIAVIQKRITRDKAMSFILSLILEMKADGHGIPTRNPLHLRVLRYQQLYFSANPPFKALFYIEKKIDTKYCLLVLDLNVNLTVKIIIIKVNDAFVCFQAFSHQ